LPGSTLFLISLLFFFFFCPRLVCPQISVSRPPTDSRINRYEHAHYLLSPPQVTSPVKHTPLAPKHHLRHRGRQHLSDQVPAKGCFHLFSIPILFFQYRINRNATRHKWRRVRSFSEICRSHNTREKPRFVWLAVPLSNRSHCSPPPPCHK